MAEKTSAGVSNSAGVPSNAAPMPGAVSGDTTRAAVNAQAQQAVQGMKEGMETAATAERLGAKSLATESPDKAPQWKEATPQSQNEQVQRAGQTMQAAGMTMNQRGPSEVLGHEVNTSPQSESTRAAMQAALDKSAQNGQNAPERGGAIGAHGGGQSQSTGSRCEAARQEAVKSGPQPSRSQSQQPGM